MAAPTSSPPVVHPHGAWRDAALSFRPLHLCANVAAEELAALPAARYVEHFSLAPYLNDAVSLLLESRSRTAASSAADPAQHDPKGALVAYFDRVARGAHVVGRGWRHVSCTARNRLGFVELCLELGTREAVRPYIVALQQ